MKTCPKCKTKNEGWRTACKSCGHTLPSSDGDAATSTGNDGGRSFGEAIVDAIETIADAVGGVDPTD